MTKCTYCGADNHEGASACSGCGASLTTAALITQPASPIVSETDAPPVIPNVEIPPAFISHVEATRSSPTRGKELKAWSAGVVFLLYFAAQVIGSIVAMIISFAFAAAHGQNLQDPQQIRRLLPALMPGIVLGAMVGGAVGMFAMAFVLVPESLRDRSPTGAAWVRGEWPDLGKALALGLIIGAAAALFMSYLEGVHGGPTSLGPVTKMAASSTSGFIIWTLSALLLAPLVEEPLFRGLLYGGLRRSFGAISAAILTSAIFILLHLTEIIHFLPAILPLGLLAVCALAVRLRFGAIGPALAVHFGYNAMLALAFYRQMW